MVATSPAAIRKKWSMLNLVKACVAIKQALPTNLDVDGFGWAYFVVDSPPAKSGVVRIDRFSY